MLTAQEMIEEQRANCSSQATQILMKMFKPELDRAAKSPSLRLIDVYIDEKDQMVIGAIIRSLKDMGYRIKFEIRPCPENPKIKKPCFTLGW